MLSNSLGFFLRKTVFAAFVAFSTWVIGVGGANSAEIIRQFDNPTNRSGEGFGLSVSPLGEDAFVVSAPYATVNGVDFAGLAYVYDLHTGARRATLPNPMPGLHDHLGTTVVGIGGSSAIVGTPGTGNNEGSAFVYDATGGFQRELTTDIDSLHYFAFDMEPFGAGQVLVGAPGYARTAWDGAVFRFDVATGLLVRRYVNPNGTEQQGDRFGQSVSAIGVDRMIVGAPFERSSGIRSGVAYVISITTGAVLSTLPPPRPQDGGTFGREVLGIPDGHVAVSAYKTYASTSDSSGVHVFAPNGSLRFTLANPDPQKILQFGSVLRSIGTEKLIVAQEGDGDLGFVSGSVYVYDLASGALLERVYDPDRRAGSRFGSSVGTFADGTVLVGASEADVSDGDVYHVRLAPRAAAALIPRDATWRYLDNGSNQGTAWRLPSFNDSTWKQGRAQLGYGDGDEQTVVNCGMSGSACTANNYATTYFRHAFVVDDPAEVFELSALLVRDDAAAIYLNGQEVFRDAHLATGAAYNAYATATSAENEASVVVLNKTLLRAGVNVIAVEVHQAASNSSDMSFSLALNAAVTPIPEPSTLGLLIAGGIAVPFNRRARRWFRTARHLHGRQQPKTQSPCR